MDTGYIDLDEISHLGPRAKGGGVYDHRLWRESYYFNFTDPDSRITMITTIGILPNRKLNTGLVVLVKNRRILCIRPMLERKQVRFNDYAFSIKGLKYSVEGTDWRLVYNSEKLSFNILFRPLNMIYPYITDASDTIFEPIGSQHYEQFGIFEGGLVHKGRSIDIGPALGHRDHSWGIRNWSPVDHYRLFCCAFSKELAFNLWQGSINGSKFLKGYVFDGDDNTPLARAGVRDVYGKDSRRPSKAVIDIRDAKGRKFKIDCRTLFSIRLPPRGSVMYESAGEMRCDGRTGYGVQEYLYHEPNSLYRLWVFLGLLRYL